MTTTDVTSPQPPAQAPAGTRPARPTVPEQVRAINADGIVSLPACLPAEWADRVREDFEQAFADARSRPDGPVGRGPHRFYFAVHPEQVRGFVELVSHPAVTALCATMLGDDYQVVELGFDVPLPGAVDQPWHRDFPTPAVTAATGRLTSLAFNLTTVDVSPELAPFEIAPGTHLDGGSEFDHGMVPRAEASARYDALGSKRYPRRGDLSARTGLTIHRGTANRSDRARAVLILGVVASEVTAEETQVHDLRLSRGYADSLPTGVREHLRCTVVDELEPLTQKHDIEGLMMGG